MRATPAQAAGRRTPTPHTCTQRSNEPSLLPRRAALLGAIAAPLLLPLHSPAPASATQLACPGERGYALQQCLRKARLERQQAEAAEGGGGGGAGGGTVDDVQAERLRYRQYEQPGELVTLPSGLQYRELQAGAGPAAEAGSALQLRYTVYRLSARATPVYAWSYGTGQGGQDDVGEVYSMRLGDPRAVPAAVSACLLGMRQGARRRILVPPRLGWVADGIGPPVPSFTAARRLATHRQEPLLFEAELVKVTPPAPVPEGEGDELLAEEGAALQALVDRPGEPFRLPAPRSPWKDKLGPQPS